MPDSSVGGGMDGVIHRAAGPSLMAELDALRARPGVARGWAVLAAGEVRRPAAASSPRARSCMRSARSGAVVAMGSRSRSLRHGGAATPWRSNPATPRWRCRRSAHLSVDVISTSLPMSRCPLSAHSPVVPRLRSSASRSGSSLSERTRSGGGRSRRWATETLHSEAVSRMGGFVCLLLHGEATAGGSRRPSPPLW